MNKQEEDRERVIQAMEEMAKKQAEESVVYENRLHSGILLSQMKRLHRCEKFKMKKEENGSRICLPCRNKRAS